MAHPLAPKSALAGLLMLLGGLTACPAVLAQASGAEPAVQRTVLEDDAVRIEELKVRGQTTRVVVRSKQLDVRAYELLIGDAGRDPSQRGRASGQRVWNLFSF